MSIYDDEQAWHEAQNEYMDRYAPPATMSDAHAEWHRNSGNPMGTPGCPMDACHLPEPEWCEDHDTYADECPCEPVEIDMSTIPHLWDYDTPYDDGIPF